MKTLVPAVVLSLLLVSANPISYRTSLMPHARQPAQPCQWSDSVGGEDQGETLPVFAIIGDVQKYLDARHLSVNVLSDRYEVYYRKTY